MKCNILYCLNVKIFFMVPIKFEKDNKQVNKFINSHLIIFVKLIMLKHFKNVYEY